MKDVILGWAMGIVLKALEVYLTPEQMDKFKADFVGMLRTDAKLWTPDFPYDDELVEILAKAMRVP